MTWTRFVGRSRAVGSQKRKAYAALLSRKYSSHHTFSRSNGIAYLSATTAAALMTLATYSENWSDSHDNTMLRYGRAFGMTTSCDANKENQDQSSSFESKTPKERAARLFRKRTTLQVATAADGKTLNNKNSKSSGGLLQRFSTKEELDKLRSMEKEMLKRWEQDEEGWRELPARAWPAYQPNPKQLEGILSDITIVDCDLNIGKNVELADMNQVDKHTKVCTELLFNMASAFVFYNVNPSAGLAQYERLANHGHVDSMVACGIILVEGLGVPPREKEGLQWLQKAVKKGSAQACYELGTIYYTGIDGIVEEDADKAFDLFELAAEQDHTAALYMVADCLVEGEGTERSVARAIPLFYKAAERGHRFSRQRIRELLARLDYPL